MDVFLPGFVGVPRRQFTINEIYSGEIRILSASPPTGQRATLFVKREGSFAILSAKVSPQGRLISILGACIVPNQESFRNLARAADTAADLADAADAP